MAENIYKCGKKGKAGTSVLKPQSQSVAYITFNPYSDMNLTEQNVEKLEGLGAERMELREEEKRCSESYLEQKSEYSDSSSSPTYINSVDSPNSIPLSEPRLDAMEAYYASSSVQYREEPAMYSPYQQPTMEQHYNQLVYQTNYPQYIQGKI